MKQRTVVVNAQTTPVYSIDPLGYKVEVGAIEASTFEGEGLQRLQFHDLDGKGYSLGHATDKWQIVDHFEVLNPFIQQGWTVAKLGTTRGGMVQFTQLKPPTPLVFSDIVSWDLDLWQERGYRGDLNVQESLIIISSVKPKKALSFRQGWFRSVCTNGMVSEVFGLGSLRMSHSTYSFERLAEWIRLTRVKITVVGETLAGPYIGTKHGADKLISVIDRHLLPVAPIDSDDESDEDDNIIDLEPTNKLVPLFVQKELKLLERQPKWYLEGLKSQLLMMVDKKISDDIHAFDMVNCVTSPVSLNPSRAVGRSMMNTNNVGQSTMSLIGGMSL